MRVAPLPPPPTSQNDLSPAQCCVIHHVLEAPFEPFVAFWSAGHTRLRTARGGRPVCTLPNHARAVPTRPPARACVVPGRSGPMFRWTGVRKGEGRDGRGGGGGAVLVASRITDPPTHLLVSFAHISIHPAPPTHLPTLYTPRPHTPARAPCQPFSGVPVRRLRVVHDTSGEIRLNPTQRRVRGSNAPTRDGVRGRGCGARSSLASVRPEPLGALFDFWSAGHARRRTARGGRSACTLPNHARAVPTRPPARACMVPGRSGPMFRWTKNVLLRSPPYLCFGLFGPQAAGGAPHEGGDPLTPCPTTRGRFQRAHPRGRAWPGGGARELRASPFSPFFAFCSAGHARRTARGGTPA